MITPDFVKAMAHYNAWQNASLVGAAETLSDDARKAPRGAFFGSIAGTFNHLLWGDAMWMHRFSGSERPPGGIRDSAEWYADWLAFKSHRDALDQAILAWAEELSGEWIAGDLSWRSSAANRDLTRPRALLVMHFFNHQTHHRGQIHAMLTASGARPDDTDLMLAPWMKAK